MSRPDLSFYTDDKITLTWAVTFGDGGYFVEEKLGAHPLMTTKWGPVPSKETAYDLIQERKNCVQETVTRMCLNHTIKDQKE